MTATANKRPALRATQLLALIAISRGEVSTPGPGINLDYGTWREGGRDGRAVTQTVDALIRKGYAQASTRIVDGRQYAEATAAGTEEISRAASRGR